MKANVKPEAIKNLNQNVRYANIQQHEQPI